MQRWIVFISLKGSLSGPGENFKHEEFHFIHSRLVSRDDAEDFIEKDFYFGWASSISIFHLLGFSYQPMHDTIF